MQPRRKIAIVGGGLAGLSVAYHLLDKSASGTSTVPAAAAEGVVKDGRIRRPLLDLTVFDKAPVGAGGASSVAGG